MKKKLLLFLAICCCAIKLSSQCTGCTVTNPVSSGSYTFANNSTVCFTQNTTLSDVTFGNNVKVCIATGVTLTIQNNINYLSTQPNLTFDISGILQFGQSPEIRANVDMTIRSGGILRAGSSGGNNFTFGGSTKNVLTNYGTVQVSVLGFSASSATNIIDNYATYTIGANINIQGNTTFRNNGNITIGQSYNNNSTSTYINCGTITSNIGYNLGGGVVINTGNFYVGSGSIDMSGSSKMQNYGMMRSLGTINGSASAELYNEGMLQITSLQMNGGTIKGPSNSSLKGYVYVINSVNPNGTKVGPNLDIKKYTSYNPDVKSASQGQSSVFNSPPVYINSSGATVTQAVSNVTYDCTTCPPVVLALGRCPEVDGKFPPVAVDDSYTILPGSSSTTTVLVNDLEQYNGAAATLTNVVITQVSTTNSGVTVSPTTGLVSVATGTPGGTYTIVYRICRVSLSTSCSTANITVTVPSSVCYKNATVSGVGLDTPMGITALGRAGDKENWPMVRKGGWIALESLSKGFVINRLTNAQIAAIPQANLVEGMTVYSITDDCIKINIDGTSSGWKCFSKQDCPD